MIAELEYATINLCDILKAVGTEYKSTIEVTHTAIGKIVIAIDVLNLTAKDAKTILHRVAAHLGEDFIRGGASDNTIYIGIAVPTNMPITFEFC